MKINKGVLAVAAGAMLALPLAACGGGGDSAGGDAGQGGKVVIGVKFDQPHSWLGATHRECIWWRHQAVEVRIKRLAIPHSISSAPVALKIWLSTAFRTRCLWMLFCGLIMSHE